MAECTCVIAVGEVHDGLCLRCRRPTSRRATAAFVSSSAPPDEAPGRPEPNSDQRRELFDDLQRRMAAEKQRLREAELRRKLKNR